MKLLANKTIVPFFGPPCIFISLSYELG